MDTVEGEPTGGQGDEQRPERAAGPVRAAALTDTRLDKAVAAVSPLSRRAAARVIGAGGVLVDGRRSRAPGARVQAGQALEIWPDAELSAASVDVVWESDALWVLDKPAGVPTEQGRRGGDALTWRVAEDLGVPLPAASHRLDLPASGLVALAKSLDARRALDAAIRQRRLARGYLALVRTWVAPSAQEIHEALDVQDGHAHLAPWGLPARTRVIPLAFDAARGVALVGVRLATGRTHQARAHLAAAVGAIVGDLRYGDLTDGATPPRIALHAAWIALAHSRGDTALAGLDVHRPPGAEFWALAPAGAEIALPEDWLAQLQAAAL